MTLFVTGSWWAVQTTAGTLFNCKADNFEEAVQKVIDYTSGARIADAWIPSSLKGKLIDKI